MKTSKALVAVLAALLLATLTISSGVTDASANAASATYVVEYHNRTTGQWLTPPNFAAHDDGIHVWQRREPASPGVQAVAENGGVPILAAELAAAIDATGRGVSLVGAAAPIGPGETVTFEITTSQDRFSLVSMIICTNDGFAGVDSGKLPGRDGQTRRFAVHGFDAGSEINTEMRTDLVPAPFCGPGDGSTDSNPELAEGGVITRHRTLRGVGDLDPALDWAGPVAELTITRLDSEAANGS